VCVYVYVAAKGWCRTIELERVRDQFDILVVNYSDTAEYLSADADIVHNSTFEKGIVKIQNGMESTLNRSEKAAVSRFLKVEMVGVVAEEEAADPVRNPANRRWCHSCHVLALH
jgi:hypothetical protein